MRDFNYYKEALIGNKLIEASAGTGKTYTLAGLYIRTIVEKKLTPEKILVLTFTKAATFELKTRLRKQLIECKMHLNKQEKLVQKDNPQLFGLYEKYSQDKASLKYVNLALACFDQAAIFTINGCCQKIITDYNQACGSPVFKQLIAKQDYVERFVYDFWRIQQQKIAPVYLSKIPKLADISYKLSSLLSKSHYRDIQADFSLESIEQLEILHNKLREMWLLDYENILDYILSGSFGSKYRPKARDSFSQAMNDFLHNLTVPKTNYVERFCFDFLEKDRKTESSSICPDFIVQFEVFYQQIQALPFAYMYENWLYVQEQLSLLLTEHGLYSYDDQIKVVHKALTNNQTLAQLIGSQWQTVMVDEFQDTDLMQLEIFQQCFADNDHNLIYVGDPKQAIYDFRGADVFVYEQAKDMIANNQRYNLATNWRSDEKMLKASNQLFDFPLSFGFEWLKFHPSLPKKQQETIFNDAYPPVVILDCEKEQRKAQLANEIRRLLSQATIEKQGEVVNISDKGIAVLVKSNNDAIELYEYLLGQNLNVSLWSESGVFMTQVAKELYYFIRTIAYPSEKNIFTCLHSLFFDVSLNDLQNVDIENLISEFVTYRLDSDKQGVAQVIDGVFKRKNVYAKLLQRMDGERVYTDLQQLLDLIQQQVDEGKNEVQISQWLAIEIEAAKVNEQDDKIKRRLESDGQKISIMTMHKSKGLEFDCIFIPYADSVRSTPHISNKLLSNIVATHDKDKQGVIYWKESEQATKAYLQEYFAENIRNFYVAITRAKHRVYLGFDSSTPSFEKSLIAKLYAQIANDQQLCAKIDENIIATPLNKKTDTRPLSVNSFHRPILQPKSIYSFSSLSKKQSIGFETQDELSQELDFNNYFQFPKGAKSGTMQHEVLEHIAFDADVITIEKEVDKQLATYGFDKKWSHCLSLQMHKIVNTKLWKDGPSLAQVEHSIDEMEFMLPIGSISREKISHWLSLHRKTDTAFNQEDLQGFLTGFIDLVFEYDNKFYVVDYKSNYLGGDFSDYKQDKLKQAIEHHYYDLQYLLYCVALLKHLKQNIKDFDLKKHFGGVAYIFTRGINSETGQGVYFTKPDGNLISEMMGAFDVRD